MTWFGGPTLDRLRAALRARVSAVWARDRAELRGARALGNRLARIAILVVRGIVAHKVKLLLAALTFYTVFSIVPLLVVVFMSLRLLDYIPATMPALLAGAPFLARHPLLESAAAGILEAV